MGYPRRIRPESHSRHKVSSYKFDAQIGLGEAGYNVGGAPSRRGVYTRRDHVLPQDIKSRRLLSAA